MWQTIVVHTCSDAGRLDTVATAVSYWNDYLNRDMTNEEDKRLSEQMDIQYAKFEEAVLGYRRPPPNFFDNY
jgi:hypothetical protein